MKNKKAFKIALMSCSAITTFAAIAAVSFNNGANNSLSKLATAGSNWIHYSGYDGGCTGVSIKEYWTNCQGTTVVEDPKGTVSEERKATAADVETITKNYGANDERLFIAGHDLHDNVCSVCHELSMTSNVVDVYSDHGTKGTATLVEDSTYSSSGYGKMYKYVHTYNDYTSKFAITNIFNSTSLDGINKVSFKIVVPEFRLLIAGNDETNYEIYASANSSTLNPVSTIITINRTEGTNDWVMTDSAKLLIKYGGGNIESASLPNRTTFAELFHNFTNWGVSNVYISDILTDKHVCNYVNGTCECGNVIITNSAIGNMSTLTVDTTYSAPTLMGNVNMYKRSGYGSGLFGDYSLEGLNEIKFYVVNEDKGNGFVLNTINGWTDYQGVISGGSAPQVVIATRSGSDWTVTTESGLYLGAAGKLASTAGPSYTVNNATKLTDILNTKSASTSIYVSDIIAKTVKKEVITKDAIATGKIATIGAEKHIH